MFAKKNRASKKDIDEIFKDGSFINSANLTFKFLIKKENSFKKVSFIVPKSVSKKAIIRNKLRRLGYLVLEKHTDLLPNGTLAVFVFKNSAGFLDKTKKEAFLNLEKEILFILSKIKTQETL
ncbi:MAG TPA: ribonuclease P protein component [Candidatus Paceibacterota bacterium]|nr:ribonuclease P protein component [Candidatus Paceibacterota bacterium]